MEVVLQPTRPAEGCRLHGTAQRDRLHGSVAIQPPLAPSLPASQPAQPVPLAATVAAHALADLVGIPIRHLPAQPSPLTAAPASLTQPNEVYHQPAQPVPPVAVKIRYNKPVTSTGGPPSQPASATHSAKAVGHAAVFSPTLKMPNARTTPISLSTEFRTWCRSEWLGFTGNRDISALCRAARTRTRSEITEMISHTLHGHAGVETFITEFLRRLDAEMVHTSDSSSETSPQQPEPLQQPQQLQQQRQPQQQRQQLPSQHQLYFLEDAYRDIRGSFLDDQKKNMKLNMGPRQVQADLVRSAKSYDALHNRFTLKSGLHGSSNSYNEAHELAMVQSLGSQPASNFSCFSPQALSHASGPSGGSWSTGSSMTWAQCEELQLLLTAKDVAIISLHNEKSALQGQVAALQEDLHTLQERLRVANERTMYCEEQQRRPTVDAAAAQDLFCQLWATNSECASLRGQLADGAAENALYKLHAMSMRDMLASQMNNSNSMNNGDAQPFRAEMGSLGQAKGAQASDINLQLQLHNDRLSEGITGLQEQLKIANERAAYEQQLAWRAEARLQESVQARNADTAMQQAWMDQAETVQSKLESKHDRLRRQLAAVTSERDGLMLQLTSPGPATAAPESEKVTLADGRQAPETMYVQKQRRILQELERVTGELSLSPSV